MQISIPVYIEQRPPKDSPRASFKVRPLFQARPERRHETLSHALNQLAKDLRQQWVELGRAGHEDELAGWSFCPHLSDHLVDLQIDVKKHVARLRLLFVEFDGLGGRLAFSPSLPEVWFMVERGQALRDRAAEVVTQHFRRRRADDDDAGAEWREVEALSLPGKAWVTTLDLDVAPAQPAEQPPRQRFATLGCAAPADGAAELEKVGRCLDRLYPDELDRATFREAEVAELGRLLEDADRRPVLLLGARGVGKTAILHEHVYRTVGARGDAYASRKNIWLLAPQRLISGMSFVGQWESRLLAILDEARKRHHVLYFDDLLGLYHAGITVSSRLSVAHVLRGQVERREVGVLAEMTPEAFRVFREVDRGLADLFHVLPVREPGEAETVRILLHVQRQLEARHGCRFALDVLPAVLDLERRHARETAFPGKAAAFLRQLAVKHRDADVTRATVLDEFHARSGLARSLLDGQARLERAEIVGALGARVMGQDAAVAAAADVIGVAKARLNDPTRPLAALLFLGPTGVGKTECAKALAAYLFGDPEKVLRFDMNELVDAGAAARLAGDWTRPEGLLTAAVRRQPFSVVLLDEIEKAHPDVFDLLLAVLGEGRLTDALGRTADFTQTIVVLTSNLGADSAGRTLGFRGEEEAGAPAGYLRAAEEFFRPELMNRLDRVIPFERLRRSDVGRIAERLLGEILQRDGLVRRGCVLAVHPEAMARVVAEGYHPLLGARALKRAVERRVVQPAAARLAGLPPAQPMVLSLYPAGADGIAVQVQGLVLAATKTAEATAGLAPEASLERVEAELDRIDASLARWRPPGEISARAVRAEDVHYFTVRDHLRRVREQAQRLAGRMAAARRPAVRGRSLPRPPRPARSAGLLRVRDYTPHRDLKDLFAVPDLHQALVELGASTAPRADEAAERLEELIRESALLAAMVAGPARRALLHVRALDGSGAEEARRLRAVYTALCAELPGLDATTGPAEEALVVDGPHAFAVLRGEEGTHLFTSAHRNLVPVQVAVSPLLEGDDAGAAWRARIERQAHWLRGLAEGAASVEADPFALGPVVRLYDGEGRTVDLRSGLASTERPGAKEMRVWVLARLVAAEAEGPGAGGVDVCRRDDFK